MGLTAFQPKTEKVEIPGGDHFVVRGLALEDLTVLLRTHYNTVERLYERYVGESAAAYALQHIEDEAGIAGLDISGVKGVVLESIDAAPALIGDVIARAADEHEHPELARLLPIGVQIDATEKIIRLTLEAEGGLEKLVESVRTIAAVVMTATAGSASP